MLLGSRAYLLKIMRPNTMWKHICRDANEIVNVVYAIL